MANNRMYMLCVHCLNKEETKIEDCICRIAKYYPSTGWYDAKGNLDEDLAEFFERHKHGSMYGEDFTLVYEGLFGGVHKAKREILELVSEYITKIQNGEGR